MILKQFYQQYLESRSCGVTEFEMRILEGEDNRVIPDGGHLIETFVHHCLIASMFVGLPTEWMDVSWTQRDKDNIHMTATGKYGEKFHLVMEKNSTYNGGEKQTARICFADSAEIQADFKKKTATILHNGNTITIGVSEQFTGKYDVQCEMVYECYSNAINTSEVDGLFNQIEVLEWLMGVVEEESDQGKD